MTDWVDEYLMPSFAWCVWVLALGCLTVRLTWKDNETKVEHEYTIPGLLQ